MASDFRGLPPDGIPLVNRDFDYSKAKLTQKEFFVLSRVDGRTTIRQLVAISAAPEAEAVVILVSLRQMGAIYFKGEDPKRPPGPDPELADVRRTPIVIDERLLAETVELTEDLKRAILTKHASMVGVSLWAILEVPRNADKKALRAARDTVSKAFHPDRPAYFQKSLGSYRRLLADITERSMEAYEVLSDDAKREAYILALEQARLAAKAEAPPVAAAVSPPPGRETPAQKKKRAGDLFNAAQIHEAAGERDRARREFKEVCQLDPSARHLLRAAEAALAAQDLRDAEEYAKKAVEYHPNSADSHRMLGKVLRVQKRLPDARKAYQQAVRLDPGNTHIAAELRAVIAEIEGDNG